MKQKKRKSGLNRLRRKDLSRVYHESVDKAGEHFSSLFLSRLKNVREVRLWVVEWALLVSVVLILALVQNIWYSNSYETLAFSEGGDFSEATLGKINTMNPLYATTNSEKVLAKLLFANLVSPDAAGKNKAELAKSVVSDETAKVWTVTLRDEIKWSDGEEITAKDIVYTVGLLKDSSAKTTASVDLSHVKIEEVDDKVVVFTLPSAYVDFMDSLEFPLLPEHILGETKPALVYESSFSENPIGSGPFVLNAMQVVDTAGAAEQLVYLSRNNNYFKGRTKLASFTLKTYKGEADIAGAVKNATVRATAELGAGYADELARLGRRRSLTNFGAFAFLNTRSNVLRDREFRQALRQGIDLSVVREGLDESQYLDYPILGRQEAELSFPAIGARSEEEAKKRLAAIEGYSYQDDKLVNDAGDQVSLRMVVQKRDTITGVAERLAEQIEALGVKVVLDERAEDESTADFFSAVVTPRAYDILVYEIDLGVNADPFVYYSSTQSGMTGWNFSNYANNIVDDALLSARTKANATLRKSKLELFLRNWVNDVPAIGLYQAEINYYYGDGAQIYSEDAQLSDAYDRFQNVQNWATRQRVVELTP